MGGGGLGFDTWFHAAVHCRVPSFALTIYGGADRGRETADVTEEFVCDRIGEAMENPSLVRSFARALEARGAGLGRRVLMAVRDFLERVREFFTRGGSSPYVRKYDALSREVGRILAGMERAGGAIGEAAGARRHSVGTRNDGRKYVKVDIDQHIFDGLSPRECLHLARRVILDRFKGKVIGDSPDNAYVNKGTAEEYSYPASARRISDDIAEAKGRASTELDELMKAATFLDHTEDDGRHPDAKGGGDHYSVEFELSPGNVFRGKISVKITGKGRVFHDMTQIEKVPASVSESSRLLNRNLGDNITPETRLSVTHSDNFRKWFGNSKVVDKNGEPLVVYHKTNAEFTEFRNGVSFFSGDARYGKSGGMSDARHSMPCYLRIENPKYVSKFTIERAGVFPGIVEDAKRDGFDGLVYASRDDLRKGETGWGDDFSQIVTFYPNQVKSATDNNGGCSLDNPDVRHSVSGLYTGTSADYDRPSLHYVGTGEGLAVWQVCDGHG